MFISHTYTVQFVFCLSDTVYSGGGINIYELWEI